MAGSDIQKTSCPAARFDMDHGRPALPRATVGEANKKDMPAMIVCSCNVIALREIEDVITGFLDADEWQLITPGMVYHAMAKRGKCCGCFPRVIDTIVSVSEAYHRDKATPEDKIIPFIARIREEHDRCETVRRLAKSAKMRKAA